MLPPSQLRFFRATLRHQHVPDRAMTCPGDQSCWEECGCDCVGDDGEPWDTCECGHRAHQTVENGVHPDSFDEGALEGAFCPATWCGNPDCELSLCMMCGAGSKKDYMEFHGGLCSPNCAITMNLGGPVQRSGTGDCPVCLETLPLVKLGQCSHEMCYACRAKQLFAKRHAANVDHLSLCPLCRASNSQAIDPDKPYAGFGEAAAAQAELRENRNLAPQVPRQ